MHILPTRERDREKRRSFSTTARNGRLRNIDIPALPTSTLTNSVNDVGISPAVSVGDDTYGDGLSSPTGASGEDWFRGQSVGMGRKEGIEVDYARVFRY